MSATKVTLVSQWYPPEPVDIPAGIIARLQEQGCAVDVLTGIPNYPSGVVADGYSAHRVASEWREGVRVFRTPLFPSHDSSAMKRMLNYLSWAISCALLGQRRLRKSDVALVYSSPATAALPAMVAKLLWGTPFVLLVQDVWPDSVFASGFLKGRLGRAVRRTLDRFVRRAYAMAAHIVVISPGMIELLVSRGVPAQKLSLVYNWLPDEPTTPVRVARGLLREEVGASIDSPVFLFAGNHGRAQALDALIDVFRDPSTAPARLVLVGDGVVKAELQSRASGADRIHFLDPVPRERAAALAADADVNVVSLADAPLFTVTMPSKVQSSLAAARPLLVVAKGDSAEVVARCEAGASAAPGDREKIRKAVAQLTSLTDQERDAMGNRAFEFYHRTMASPVGASRLARVLRDAAYQTRLRKVTSVSDRDQKEAGTQ